MQQHLRTASAVLLLELPLDMNGYNCSSGSFYLLSACICYLLVLKVSLQENSSLGICVEEQVFCADGSDPFSEVLITST